MLTTGAATAQSFPEKPVTLIAPFSAGGSVDLVARAVAQQMSELWKQPVIVSNRPGASGNIGVEAVVRAAPDGYTLLLGTTALSSSPALFAKLPFDPVRDLAPVSLVVTMPNVLVVHPSLPARTVKELLALAKAQPGVLESLAAPRLKDVLVNAGADAVGNMPDEFARFFQNEIVKWGKVVRAAGIKEP